MKKRILVTGGTGYIGSHTVVELIEAGYHVTIVDDFSNSDIRGYNGIKTITKKIPKLEIFDISTERGFYELYKLGHYNPFDGVIHFAAMKAVGESVQKPIEYYKNNIDGLLSVLESMITNKTPNLIFSSSCTVYGQPKVLPVTEQSPIQPATSPYGYTKQAAEQIISDVVKVNDINAISLRYFNPIGAHPSGLIGELPIGNPNNLVPYITQVAAGLRKELTVFGNDYSTTDGYGVRDFIHVVDLALAHIKTLEYLHKQQCPFYDVFNVGTGTGNSVLEIIKTFEKVNGIKVPYEIGPRRAGDIAICYANANKIKKEMGWKAKKSLEDSLRDAWKWQKQINC
jgi:UDP-glucose 4-epimerase